MQLSALAMVLLLFCNNSYKLSWKTDVMNHQYVVAGYGLALVGAKPFWVTELTK